jgi:hypothetical protein
VKRILALALAVVGMLGLAGARAYPQQPAASGLIDSDFSDDATAEQVVREIMKVIGMPAGSVTVRPGHVPNVEVEGSTRLILYNPAYLERAKAEAGPVAVYQIMSHELGHVLIRMSPGFEAGRSRHELELEADRISGAILFNLHATLDEAVSAPQMLLDDEGDPPRRNRIRAVAAGWNEAKRRSSGQGNGRRPVEGAPPRSRRRGELFASNLGIFYTRLSYSDGTFGARLTRPPAAGSPASRTGLEPGDVIVALDGTPFRDPEDFLGHTGRVRMTLIDGRTGHRIHANLVLGRDEDEPPAPGRDEDGPPAPGRDEDGPAPVPDVAPPAGPVGP